MFINDKMKVNKFKLVAIPRNRDYFGRLGNNACPESMYSGDVFIPQGNKVDVLAYMDAYDAMKQREESKSKSE